MAIEQTFKSFKKDMQRARGVRDSGTIYSFKEAIEVVRDLISSVQIKEELSVTKVEDKKDKASLRRVKEKNKAYVSDAVYNENIRVRDMSAEEFIKRAVEEFVGYSVLYEAFEDPGVSDIFCMQWDKIYIEKNGENEKYPHTFFDATHYKNFIERVLRDGGSGVGKELNNGDKKIVDAEFYGDRIIATSKIISPKDYSITFRKHSESHIKLQQIIDQGVLNADLADFLGQVILGESNLIYAGITGSGKTTTIRALLDHYVTLSNKRMIVCEDTQELFPQNDHTLELVSHKNADSDLSIELNDIILSTLRLKPKYIVVGEVRGKEAQAAVEAAETGHSTIFTMHGGKPINIINRLVTKYLMAMPSLGIDVVERIIGSAIDYIAIQDDIPGIGRRVSVITEVSFNYETGRVDLKPIYEFDFATESYKMMNKMSPEKAINLLRRGVKRDDIKQYVEGWS